MINLASRRYCNLTYLALVDSRVPGHDVLDLQDPVVASPPGPLLLLLDQLEAAIRGEGEHSVRQDLPVVATHPGELRRRGDRARSSLSELL